ncbi:FkbM family methyltransferase [Oceanicella actignis]|uniref:Methyltransferase, FkbM family n=1 Tax=Oceanicella actignis TaxID=1189325 RepID=A0A1M7TWV8_9RHOB|nr:FkbM family methyltransferase [Oceanicella actignis]TYO89577.1 FkbM family methyltransferase [Oceanicella actignis]SET79686.1 methyltransferase, FkbM family [Oceanicella actignis]SHN75219.1 methyltransferase, FkbM family [Oceanicella actignis]
MKALQDLFARAERACARLQGKGWGTATAAAEVAAARRLLGGRTARLCVDVGGNAGEYAAALLRAFPEARVEVFEPAAVNVAALGARFADEPRLRVHPFALGAREGEATLHADRPGSGLGSLTRRGLDHARLRFTHEEPVRVMRFERFWIEELGRAPMDLVKLDVEGHELDALEGFGAALDAARLVQFEFGGCNIDTRTWFRDFWRLFDARGFDLFRITPFGPVPVPRYRESCEAFVTTNYLARRRG